MLRFPNLTTLFPESSNAHKAPSGGYTSRVHVLDRYKVVGFISSGTYGRVYKAVGINGRSGEFAIKKYNSLSHLFDFPLHGK